MKIVIATPIYPPEIGGPATYTKNLREGLEKKGHSIKIVSYQGLKRYPQPLKIILYSLRLFKNAKGCDLIYAFNLISCGLPTCFISKILRKKFSIRTGGDFLWERAVEAGKTKKPLKEYYQSHKTLKERFWICLIRKILNKVDKIIFTSYFQKDIYLKLFDIKEEKIVIIPNPFPEIATIDGQSSVNNYQLLYAGRLLKLKNLQFLINVFYKVLEKTDKDLTLKIIGQGPEKNNLKADDKVVFNPPVSHQDLLKEIQQSYLCLLPSLTEITPNFALECIKLGKPILLTKETSYYESLKDKLIFIDPQNETDLLEKILHLLDEKNYSNYIEKIKSISTDWSWDKVIEQHEKSFIH